MYKSKLLKTAATTMFPKTLVGKTRKPSIVILLLLPPFSDLNKQFILLIIFKRKAFNWRQFGVPAADGEDENLIIGRVPAAAASLSSREFRWPNQLNVIKRN